MRLSGRAAQHAFRKPLPVLELSRHHPSLQVSRTLRAVGTEDLARVEAGALEQIANPFELPSFCAQFGTSAF
eukprot:1920519-Rhodomonas_salina.2